MTSKPKVTSSVRGEYIETETGNKISRRASILGPKHIILAGKCVIQHDAIIHGDLVRPTTSTSTKPSSDPSGDAATTTPKDAAVTSVHLGRYVFISASCTLHPPSRVNNGVLTYYPLRIADNVFIGNHSTVRAASISSNVHIGSHCTIGNMVIIKENVRVLDHTVLPANTVWASGTVVGGRPGQVVGEIGEGWEGKEGKGTVGDEGIGVGSRGRWAAVTNKR